VILKASHIFKMVLRHEIYHIFFPYSPLLHMASLLFQLQPQHTERIPPPASSQMSQVNISLFWFIISYDIPSITLMSNHTI